MATKGIFFKVGLVLCVISLVLQALGYTCPGWVHTKIYLHLIRAILGVDITGFGHLTTMVAVWYGQVCLEADYMDAKSCSIDTDHDARFYGFRITDALAPLADVDWTLVRICLTLALYMCCLGTFLAALSLCSTRISPRLLTAFAAASMLASGGLIIPAVLEVSLSISDASEGMERLKAATGYELAEIKVSWALILSCIGVLIACAGFLCLVVAACKGKGKKSLEITPDSSKFLFDVKIADDKDIEVTSEHDEDFFTKVYPKIDADHRAPRIGEPDIESLVFENVPFRGGRVATQGGKNGQGNGNFTRENSTTESQSSITENADYKKRPVSRNASDVSSLNTGYTGYKRDSAGSSSNAKITVEEPKSVESKRDGAPLDNDSMVNKEKTKTVLTSFMSVRNSEVVKKENKTGNTYYTSLATEGIPASRPLPEQKQRAHKKDSKGGRSSDRMENEHKGPVHSSRMYNQDKNKESFEGNERKTSKETEKGSSMGNEDEAEKQPGISFIAVSPFGHADRVMTQGKGHERRKRSLTKREQTLLDINAIYGQKLTRGTNRHGQVVVPPAGLAERKHSTVSRHMTREETVESW